MKVAVINHRRYTVEGVFNMVLNYYFTDKHGTAHLVDAEDVASWADEEARDWTNGIDMAIEYARYYAELDENGIFWWTVKL